MELECTRQGDVTVLAPRGSINTESAPKLEQKLLELMGSAEKRFVVDFAGVDYISSAGLRVLLMAAKRLKVAGGALALCCMSAGVSKVFALCGFERDFTIVESRKRAVARVVPANRPPSGDPAATPAAPLPQTASPPAPPPVPIAVTASATAPAAGSAPEVAALLTRALGALSPGLATGGRAGRVQVSPDLVERARRALSGPPDRKKQ